MLGLSTRTVVLLQRSSPPIQKATSSINMHCATTCTGCMCCRLFALLHSSPPTWCTNGGAYKYAVSLALSQCLGCPKEYNGASNVGYGALGALWTRRFIVEAAVRCRTEPAIAHIAYIFQKLHFVVLPFLFTITQSTTKKYANLSHTKSHHLTIRFPCRISFCNLRALPQRKFHDVATKQNYTT